MTQSTMQSKVGLGQVGQPEPNYCVAEYDFAVDGGLVSQITLRGDTIPSGAQIVDADIIVQTALTGAGATISVDSEAAADLNTADALTGAPWSTTGPKKADKLAAADNGFLTTADRAIKITVGVAALTAGKFKVVVKYWMLA